MEQVQSRLVLPRKLRRNANRRERVLVEVHGAQNVSKSGHLLQIALRQAESSPYRIEIAEINRFHAAMLLDRNASQDRERAAAF